MAGKNKAVVVDSAIGKAIKLPVVSPKDMQSISLGLKEGAGYIAASFMRGKSDVLELKRLTKNKMKVISKIECVDALAHLDEIIEVSDYLLIDRGDLSKEIPIEKIPLTQKIIIQRAREKKCAVFVATNLLENMIERTKPTRAEVNDVINTVLDGATGLTLAAETAIGKYPIKCINMLNNLICHAQLAMKTGIIFSGKRINRRQQNSYLLDTHRYGTLVAPHGGRLVSRFLEGVIDQEKMSRIPSIIINEEQHMDLEQIAVGAFSPLEGFMNSVNLKSVLNTLRLTNGVIWPIPILLDISKNDVKKISGCSEVCLRNRAGDAVALLHLEEVFRFDKNLISKKMFGTIDIHHPGVKHVNALQPFFAAGKIDLIKRRDSVYHKYELTPRQVRKLFAEKGWVKIVGFHTRNVIHRGHEFIQLQALEEAACDGLFIHPVIGKKKIGDFRTEHIIKSKCASVPPRSLM